jgi:hypothetical protein
LEAGLDFDSARRGLSFMRFLQLARCLFLVLAGVLAFGGCQTATKRLTVPAVRKIVPEQTTMAEVEKMFGPPHERITGSNGRTVVRYYYGEPRLNNHVNATERYDHPADLILRTLTLEHGPDATIRRKLHDESVTPMLRTGLRLNAGPDLKPASLAFLKNGRTTKAELLAGLGEPTSTSFDTDGLPALMWFSGSYHVQHITGQEAKRLVVKLNLDSRLEDFAVMDNDLDFLWRTRR